MKKNGVAYLVASLTIRKCKSIEIIPTIKKMSHFEHNLKKREKKQTFRTFIYVQIQLGFYYFSMTLEQILELKRAIINVQTKISNVSWVTIFNLVILCSRHPIFSWIFYLFFPSVSNYREAKAESQARDHQYRVDQAASRNNSIGICCAARNLGFRCLLHYGKWHKLASAFDVTDFARQNLWR